MENKKKYNQIPTESEYELTKVEQDLYALSDNRIWTSNLEDINDGDNFADYCREFFKMLDEEEYYDN